jgi:cytoskeletal protein CcmA (bactofilin family)
MGPDKKDDERTGDAPFGDIEFQNYIGPGNVIDGKCSFKGTTLLAGSEMLGRIAASDNETEIYVGPKTKITGDIKGNRVVFGGVMDGTIDSPRLHIIKEGIFSGDIATDRGLSVEEGARLCARIKMRRKKKAKTGTRPKT